MNQLVGEPSNGYCQALRGTAREVMTSRVAIRAFGETRPKVATEDGVREPLNRRVEILIDAR